MANTFILKINDAAREGYVKRAFPVGDTTGKVKLGYFIKVSDTEACASQPGRATIVYAGATDVPAGIVYKTSAKDRMGRRDDFDSDDDYFYKIGNREENGLALVREIPVLIQKAGVDNYKHFNNRAVQLVASAAAVAGVVTNATVAANVKIGDKLTVNGTVGFVKTIAGSDVTLVKEDGTTIGAVAAGAVIKKGQIGDVLYYNPNQADAALGNREELPVLPFKTASTDRPIAYVVDVDSYIVDIG